MNTEKIISVDATAQDDNDAPVVVGSALAAIGDKNAVLAFKSLGLDVFYETGRDGLRTKILELEKKGYCLILIAEKEAELVYDFLQTYDAKPYPVILSIPDGRGTSGFGISKIISNMERAVGSSAALRN